MKTLDQRYSDVGADCLIRIQGLRALLDSVERRVKNEDANINDLGELQSVPTILDCRLATLGAMRSAKKEQKSS